MTKTERTTARLVSASNPEALAEATRFLVRGQAIAFPTDTVYGIGVPAFDPQAVARLYTIKERPLSKPIPILIGRVEDLNQIARSIPEVAWELAQEFWPGGLTLILPGSPQLPDILTADDDTVAIRLPDHPVPVEIIRALGSPLAATSANLSGHLNPTRAQEVAAQLGNRIPLIIDGGSCPAGIPSSLVDLSRKPARLLRSGAIPVSRLKSILPELGQ
jgi:L-threonylcarbamoyladenylate synthase